MVNNKQNGFLQGLCDAIEKSKIKVRDDEQLLNQCLEGYDKNFYYKLKNFILGDKNFSLEKLLEYKKKLNYYLFELEFFHLDKISMEKAVNQYNQNLFLSVEFSSPFANLEYSFCNKKIKIDVTRSEKKLDEELKNDFSKYGFMADKIIDIEFFEYNHEEEEINMHKGGREISKLLYEAMNIDYSQEKEILSEVCFHREKEKLHLQYVVGTYNGKETYFPVYIGIGTNEPFNLKFKAEFQKERYYILDLISNNLELVHKYKENKISNSDKFMDNIKKIGNSNFETILDTFDPEKNQIIFKELSRKTGKFKKFYKVEGEFRHLGFFVSKFVSEVEIIAKLNPINRLDFISKNLKTWSNQNDLYKLLIQTDKEYLKYFRLKYDTDRLAKFIEWDKLKDHLNRYKGNIVPYTTDDDGNLLYYKKAHMAEDLSYLEGIDNRFKFLSLFLGTLVINGNFDDIILDPNKFKSEHDLFKK